jgi:PAS domain S-box-containing protein
VLETTVDAVITIGEDACVQSFNPAAERIFGYRAHEVVGKNVSMLMPEPYHSEHDGYVRAYRETGRRKIIGIGREVTGLRKNGDAFPMDLAVSEVTLEGRVLFTGIVRDISDRRLLERELLRIQTEERQRIGQDLHDGLGQMLTGTGLITQQLARRLRAEGSPAADDADEIVTLIREADHHARSLARGLVPVDLEQDGLPAALARLCRQAETLFAITSPLEVVGPAEEAAGTLAEATHLYRIAQEAISNGVRHGRARRVVVALVAGPEHLRLRIEDDGSGIRDAIVAGGPDHPAPLGSDEHHGMGVRIMHDRARIMGGTLEIRPGAERGTVVTCTVPLRARAAPDATTPHLPPHAS